MNSQILYFIETSPLREQIFNSYMDDAVTLWNEEFLAEAVYKPNPVALMEYINLRWYEMVRDN